MGCVNDNHQSFRSISVDGIKPHGAKWMECTSCGQKLLMQVIASYPVEQIIRKAREKKVEVVRQFVSKDGRPWDTLENASDWNDLLAQLREIESFLIPRSEKVEKGEGYIQQEEIQVAQVMMRLARLAHEFYKVPVGEKIVSLDDLIQDIFGTFVPATFDDPLYNLYKRLRCIDSQSREWQTPVLATHPEMGKQVNLTAP